MDDRDMAKEFGLLAHELAAVANHAMKCGLGKTHVSNIKAAMRASIRNRAIFMAPTLSGGEVDE